MPDLNPGPLIRIVDDDASFGRALARLLRLSGFAVRTFTSAADFLADPEPDVPGCLITDLQMPGMSGLDLQDRLAKEGNGMPVVFLSGRGDIPSTVLAMRRGAEDFLTKTAPKNAVLDAVRHALARDGQARLERSRRAALRAPFAALTPREREILGHVLLGRMNKQIAAELGIDERSVKRHRSGFMAKLGVRSVAELTHLAETAELWDGRSLAL